MNPAQDGRLHDDPIDSDFYRHVRTIWSDVAPNRRETNQPLESVFWPQPGPGSVLELPPPSHAVAKVPALG